MLANIWIFICLKQCYLVFCREYGLFQALKLMALCRIALTVIWMQPAASEQMGTWVFSFWCITCWAELMVLSSSFSSITCRVWFLEWKDILVLILALCRLKWGRLVQRAFSENKRLEPSSEIAKFKGMCLSISGHWDSPLIVSSAWKYFIFVVNTEKKDNANVFYEVYHMNIQYNPVITCIIHSITDTVWSCSCLSLVKTNLSATLEFRDIIFFSVIPLKIRSKASNFWDVIKQKRRGGR